MISVIVWYLTFRWRRTWLGASVLTMAVSLLASAWYAVYLFQITRLPIIMPELVSVMLGPYTVMVAIVGLFILLMPTRLPNHVCRRCRYDLSGLDPVGLVCPECGTPSNLIPSPPPAHLVCPGCCLYLSGVDPELTHCPACGRERVVAPLTRPMSFSPSGSATPRPAAG
ncbi:MAG: hypothetical protein JNM07_02045 [Phycisphaerae bacterium]|nr:hypothetical protein [Phycisphaerae bacterium]